MAASDTLSALARSHPNIAADRITSDLAAIQQVHSSDETLKKMVPFRLQRKSHNEKIRRSKLLQYQGPDTETLELLQSHCDLWLAYPDLFWYGLVLLKDQLSEPQTQIVGFYLLTNHNDAHSRIARRCACIMLVKLRERHACYSEEDTVTALGRSGLFRRNPKQLRDVLTSMIDAGHRYRNIEKVLGVGSTFVLGKDVAESAWRKLVPKKGQDFHRIMRHLRSTCLPQWASTYARLSSTVIQYALNYYANVIENMQMPEQAPPRAHL